MCCACVRILVGSGGGKRGRGREIAREKGVGEGERVGRKNMEEGGREGGRERWLERKEWGREREGEGRREVWESGGRGRRKELGKRPQT